MYKPGRQKEYISKNKDWKDLLDEYLKLIIIYIYISYRNRDYLSGMYQLILIVSVLMKCSLHHILSIIVTYTFKKNYKKKKRFIIIFIYF